MPLDFHGDKHTFSTDKIRAIIDRAVEEFNETPRKSLAILDGYGNSFYGVGVYALYYDGDDQLYLRVTQPQELGDRPIYVGKAVPSGWRTARGVVDGSETTKLSGRIREHMRSIKAAENLDLEDFSFRAMIMKDEAQDLISTVEAELIRRYEPVWNTVIDGFGNHDPGRGRHDQAPSEWDTLHPGRAWAERLRGEPPEISDIKEKLRKAQ